MNSWDLFLIRTLFVLSWQALQVKQGPWNQPLSLPEGLSLKRSLRETLKYWYNMDNALSNDIYVDQGFYNNIAFAKRVLSIKKEIPKKHPYPQLRLCPSLTEQHSIPPILASLHKFLNVMPMRPSKKLYGYMWNEVYHGRPERWRRQGRFCLRWWDLS